MKIYVASSWRNSKQAVVVAALRAEGHEVYDFRNPVPGNDGFSWKSCAPDEALKDPRRFRDEVLTHPIARQGFTYDMDALRAADATVLVLPCGRSAHLELGWASGAGKRTIVLLDDPMSEPELMYLMNTAICVSMIEVERALTVGHDKRFFMFDVDGAHHSAVALDRAHAIRLLHHAGDVYTQEGDKSIEEALASGAATVIEIDTDRASRKMCHTEDAAGGRPPRGKIPLSECEIGEWFSSEY